MSWHLAFTSPVFQGILMLLFLIGLVKGLNEVCKALDRKQALIAVLAEDCQDPKYKKLITVS